MSNATRPIGPWTYVIEPKRAAGSLCWEAHVYEESNPNADKLPAVVYSAESREVCEQRARLIAAAPDLLAAAHEALAVMDALASERSLPMICEHSREALRTAIASATGPASHTPDCNAANDRSAREVCICQG